MMRLNKFLAHAGIASRRKCDDLITAGYVTVNDERITKLGVRIDETKDIIKYKGKLIRFKDSFIYVLLNKPKGVVSTANDEFQRNTVIELVSIPERIYSVGRLDYNTTGVLLLTSDGELTNRLLHPRYKAAKVYRVLIDKPIRQVDLRKLSKGVEIDEEMTLPCKIKELRVIDNSSYLEIELKEGRYRQIRKMFNLLNYEVQKLERISFAGLTAKGLLPGSWRYLTQPEITRLKEDTNYDD